MRTTQTELIEYHLKPLEESVRTWANQKRLPAAQLVVGIPGTGKRELVRYLTQWANCSTTPFSQPCMTCPPCIKFINGNWPDWIEIKPEEGEGNPSIKIDQLRDLQKVVSFAPHEGNQRVVLIDQAHRMTVQAANSLLKLLEEPPAHTSLFLTSTDLGLVLPTIRSRCQMIRLRPLPDPLLLRAAKEAFPQFDEGTLQERVVLAQGSLEKVRQLCNEDHWSNRQRVVRFIRAPFSELSPLVDWAAQDTESCQHLVDWLEQLSVAEISGSANTRNPKIVSRLMRLQKSRTELAAPINRKLFVQNLLSHWLVP